MWFIFVYSCWGSNSMLSCVEVSTVGVGDSQVQRCSWVCDDEIINKVACIHCASWWRRVFFTKKTYDDLKDDKKNEGGQTYEKGRNWIGKEQKAKKICSDVKCKKASEMR